MPDEPTMSTHKIEKKKAKGNFFSLISTSAAAIIQVGVKNLAHSFSGRSKYTAQILI